MRGAQPFSITHLPILQIISSNRCLSGSSIDAVPDTCLARSSLSTIIAKDLAPKGQCSSPGRCAESADEMCPLMLHSLHNSGLHSIIRCLIAKVDWIVVLLVSVLSLFQRGRW